MKALLESLNQRLAILISALCLAASCRAEEPPSTDTCAISNDDGTWLQTTVSKWESGMASIFGRKPEKLPLVYIVGSDCIWATGSEACAWISGRELGKIDYGEEAYGLYGVHFAGEVELPSGHAVNAIPFAFSAPYDDGNILVAVASADVWRRHFPPEAIADVPDFIEGVVLHELVHTQQQAVLERLVQISESDPVYADLDDEMLQRVFGETPSYVAAMRAERTDLIQAIKEKHPAEARHLAVDILNNYRMRQHNHFGDRYEIMRTLEDNFLTMEGIAVWFAFQVLPPAGAAGGAPADIAEYYSGKIEGSWMQAHGGLFVALLDRLDTNWRGQAFRNDITLPDLLESIAAE